MLARQLTIEELASEIPDGSKVALPPDYAYCALSAVRALIRQQKRELHLVGVPSLGFQADMLIGAGCVATVETAAVSLSEYGLAPRFTASVKSGSITMMDATCPAIHAALQASEKGIPFILFPNEQDENSPEAKDIRSGEQMVIDPTTWSPPAEDLEFRVTLKA